MIESWVFWTLLAALMQSVRTAGQKYLAGHISPLGATLVRFLYGFPFVMIWLSLLLVAEPSAVVQPGQEFYVYASAAGILQIVATVLLIRLFSLRSFVVGSVYVRSEILLTALAGTLLFSEVIPWSGWIAIAVSTMGLVVVGLGHARGVKRLWNRSAAYGLGAGFCFALSFLAIRSASLSLGMERPVLQAAVTLAFTVTLQTLVTGIWVLWRNTAEMVAIFRLWRPGLFVGVTSMAGSVGWFTAFTLERAAYVKTLGQVEFLISLLLSVFYFREKPESVEMTGMLLIVCGVIVLLLSS